MRKICRGKEIFELKCEIRSKVKMNNSGKIAEMKEMKEGERKEILRY
jgi:hypothetical protein